MLKYIKTLSKEALRNVQSHNELYKELHYLAKKHTQIIIIFVKADPQAESEMCNFRFPRHWARFEIFYCSCNDLMALPRATYISLLSFVGPCPFALCWIKDQSLFSRTRLHSTILVRTIYIENF